MQRQVIGLYLDGSRQSWLFGSRHVIPWSRKTGMFPASCMNWLKGCAKYKWVAVNRLIQTLFIPSGPGAFQISVLAISWDTCSVVMGLCSIAVPLDTLVCSLLIQLAFRLSLTAFPPKWTLRWLLKPVYPTVCRGSRVVHHSLVCDSRFYRC